MLLKIKKECKFPSYDSMLDYLNKYSELIKCIYLNSYSLLILMI